MEYKPSASELENQEKIQPLFEFVPVDYADRTQVMCTVGRPADASSHFHLDGELILALEGTAFICCEGRGYSLKKGELFFVNPMTVHSLEATSEDALLLTVHFDMGATTLTFGADADPFCWEFLLHPGCLDEERMEILRHELLCLAGTFFDPGAEAGQRLEIPGRLLCFFSYLFRWKLYRKRETRAEFLHYEIDQGRSLMLFIKANAGRELTLAEAAASVGMTVRGALELLKKLTGRSFSDYLTGMRLEMAKKKLIFENDKSVLDICWKAALPPLPPSIGCSISSPVCPPMSSGAR